MDEDMLMRSLLTDLTYWLGTKQERDEAIADGGYDASYFCHREIDREQKALKDVGASLNAVIDARVEAALANHLANAETC